MALLMVADFDGFKNYQVYNQQNGDKALLMENLEVLAQGPSESDNDFWFSRLQNVKCEISKVNAGGGAYIKGVWVAGGGSYTVYGNKWACERAFTTNSCLERNQAECKENT